VIFPHIDIIVEGIIVSIKRVERDVGVGGRILSDEEPTAEDSSGHVVQTFEGDGTVVDRLGEVGAKVTIVRAKGYVSRPAGMGRRDGLSVSSATTFMDH